MGILVPKMDYELYTIHYPTLCKILEEENNKDPDRTWGDLDVLKDNIANNLQELLKGGDTAVIELDHDAKEVTLLGEELQGWYDSVMRLNSESDQERIYNHFLNAIRQAKMMGKYSEVFKNLKGPELYDEDGARQVDTILNDKYYVPKEL